MNTDRVRDVIIQHRVKLHVFEPSGRVVWSIVGTEKEYWADPDVGFCSCPGYYFGSMTGVACYHLGAIESARKNNSIEKIIFDDDEYGGFVSGILRGLSSR